MKKNLKIILLILITLIVGALLINWINKKNSVSDEEQILSQIFTVNVPIKELLITEEMVSPELKTSGPKLVRTRRDHGDELDVAFFASVDGNRGSIYQEVVKFPNAYRAWYLVYDTPNFPDSGWVVKEEYQLNLSNNADQWLMGCKLDQYKQTIFTRCALVARYKDIVITIEATFYEGDFTPNQFLEIVKSVDEKASELIIE